MGGRAGSGNPEVGPTVEKRSQVSPLPPQLVSRLQQSPRRLRPQIPDATAAWPGQQDLGSRHCPTPTVLESERADASPC